MKINFTFIKSSDIGTNGGFEKTLRKKQSIEEIGSIIKSSETIQKKKSLTKVVTEKRKCSVSSDGRDEVTDVQV